MSDVQTAVPSLDLTVYNANGTLRSLPIVTETTGNVSVVRALPPTKITLAAVAEQLARDSVAILQTAYDRPELSDVVCALFDKGEGEGGIATSSVLEFAHVAKDGLADYLHDVIDNRALAIKRMNDAVAAKKIELENLMAEIAKMAQALNPRSDAPVAPATPVKKTPGRQPYVWASGELGERQQAAYKVNRNEVGMTQSDSYADAIKNTR